MRLSTRKVRTLHIVLPRMLTGHWTRLHTYRGMVKLSQIAYELRLTLWTEVVSTPKRWPRNRSRLKNVLRIQVLDEFGAGQSVNVEINTTVGDDNGDRSESSETTGRD